MNDVLNYNVGWSQYDYDEYVSGGEVVAHAAFSYRSERDSSKRFVESDHIWEVQLIATAIREMQRFGPEYQLSLSQLIYVFETVNDLQNINGTPWKINLYKGKLLKEFKQYFQVTRTALSLDSIIIGNNTFLRIFNINVPLASCNGVDALTPSKISSNLKSCMKDVLVNHFYRAFFYNRSDEAPLNMLYAVMCYMYEAMFPKIV